MRQGQVKLQRGVARQRSHYRVFHDSHNGDGRTRRSAEIRRDNPLADGVAARPKAPREPFVHNARARRIGAVFGAEFATLQERDAQRTKEARRNRTVVHAQAVSEIVALEGLQRWLLARTEDGAAAEELLGRNGQPQTRPGDSRQRARPFQQSRVEAQPFGSGVALNVQIHGGQQHVFRMRHGVRVERPPHGGDAGPRAG